MNYSPLDSGKWVTSKTAISGNKTFQRTNVFMMEEVEFEVVSGCAEYLELKTMPASSE
jgi:hypothetical protein